MPSSPKIQKENILKAALEMLIRDGYASVNIKTVAQELGCSTQPISRQFGSMEGFRKELLEYCVAYLKSFFCLKEEDVAEVVMGIAERYVDLAFDYPNLYKYLYMSEQDGASIGTKMRSLRSENYSKVVEKLVKKYDISTEAAEEYIGNMDFYVHGIASYVSVGFVGPKKQDVMIRIQKASDGFLAYAKGETV